MKYDNNFWDYGRFIDGVYMCQECRRFTTLTLKTEVPPEHCGKPMQYVLIKELGAKSNEPVSSIVA